MQGETAVVIGATGFIGQLLVQELLQDNAFSTIRLLVRTPLDITHPRLDVRQVNFDDMDDIRAKMGAGDIIFCCVGTTLKKVRGNKAAYRKVDYDIPIHTGRAGVENGFYQYLLVSAIGANPVSDNFYLHLKGMVEEDVSLFPFDCIHIFRPSVLLGKRKEFRLAELIAKKFMNATAFLLMGSLRKYKPIRGLAVARAMITAAKRRDAGVHVYEYDQMMTGR